MPYGPAPVEFGPFVKPQPCTVISVFGSSNHIYQVYSRYLIRALIYQTLGIMSYLHPYYTIAQHFVHTQVCDRRLHARRSPLYNIIITMPENYHTTAGSWALIRLYTLRLYTFNYVSGQGEWVGLDELTALSRPGASLRPGRARRSRDHLATDSVRSKLPPLSVPVSPSCVELAVILWRSIGPSTMAMFKLRTSLSAHPHVRKCYTRFNLHVQGERHFLLYLRHKVRHNETAEEGCV